MAHDLRPNLDQFLPQRRQRPVTHRSGPHRLPQEIAQVIRQHEQLQPHLVVHKVVTGQTGAFDGVLALPPNAGRQTNRSYPESSAHRRLPILRSCLPHKTVDKRRAFGHFKQKPEQFMPDSSLTNHGIERRKLDVSLRAMLEGHRRLTSQPRRGSSLFPSGFANV